MSGRIFSVSSFRFTKIPNASSRHLPFEGKAGRWFAGMMKFYNRRLVSLAKRRLATGYFGRHNAGWRELYDGFVPDFRLRHLLRKGLLRWWKCELVNLGLMLRSRKQRPMWLPPLQRKAVPCHPERQRRTLENSSDHAEVFQLAATLSLSVAFSGGNISTGRSQTFPSISFPS